MFDSFCLGGNVALANPKVVIGRAKNTPQEIINLHFELVGSLKPKSDSTNLYRYLSNWCLLLRRV